MLTGNEVLIEFLNVWHLRLLLKSSQYAEKNNAAEKKLVIPNNYLTGHFTRKYSYPPEWLPHQSNKWACTKRYGSAAIQLRWTACKAHHKHDFSDLCNRWYDNYILLTKHITSFQIKYIIFIIWFCDLYKIKVKSFYFSLRLNLQVSKSGLMIVKQNKISNADHSPPRSKEKLSKLLIKWGTYVKHPNNTSSIRVRLYFRLTKNPLLKWLIRVEDHCEISWNSPKGKQNYMDGCSCYANEYNESPLYDFGYRYISLQRIWRLKNLLRVLSARIISWNERIISLRWPTTK